MAAYLGSYKDCLSVFGAVSACYVGLAVGTRIIRLLSKFIGRRFPVDVKKYGRWAVVTGCTEGIGKSYALQLAEKGMDIVLVSRNPQKLSAVAEHIVQQYQVSVKVITADFRNTDIYDGIKKQLSGLDIGILVNNVGITNLRTPGYFCDADDFEQNPPNADMDYRSFNFHRDIVNVNVLSYLMMTGIVLPEMLERKRGAIINISSIAGLRPMPFCSVYSATKAFGYFLAQALNLEYSSHGVTIQVVTPAMTRTAMTERFSKVTRIGSCFFAKADDVVRAALKTIGRESSTAAYWPHELIGCAIAMMPDSNLRSAHLKNMERMAELLKSQ